MDQSSTPSDAQTLFALSPEERFEYFVQHCAQIGRVWGLVSERGWALAAENEQACLVLWPTAELAQACAIDEWSDNRVQDLSLEQLQPVLEQLTDGDMRVAVFMTPQGKGLVVSAQDLWLRLQAELEPH